MNPIHSLTLLQVVSCDFVSRNHTLQVQEYAYHALESVVNFHNMMWQIKQANINNYNTVVGMQPAILNTFADGKGVQKHHDNYQRDFKLAMHTIIGVTLIVTAIAAVPAAMVAPAVGLASGTLVTVAGSMMPATVVAAEAATWMSLTAAEWGVVTAVSGLVGALEVGAVSVVTDLMHSP
jgi:hypothetical protein